MKSVEFYSTNFTYVLVLAFAQIFLALIPSLLKSKKRKKNFFKVFFSLLISGVLVAECLYVFKALFSDGYLPVISEFKTYAIELTKPYGSSFNGDNGNFLYYVLFGTLMTFSISVAFKGIALALSIIYENVWRNVTVLIFKIAFILAGSFFFIKAMVNMLQPFSVDSIIIYIFLLALFVPNIAFDFVSFTTVWGTAFGAGISSGIYFLFTLFDWICVKVNWLGIIIIILIILLAAFTVYSIVLGIHDFFCDLFDKIFNKTPPIDFNDYDDSDDDDDYDDCIDTGDTEEIKDPSKKVYHHYKTSVKTTSSYHDGVYDIDYDATFYYRNGYGDEETKSAGGRVYGCTSDYLSTSDVEYRHSYMLNDFT